MLIFVLTVLAAMALSTAFAIAQIRNGVESSVRGAQRDAGVTTSQGIEDVLTSAADGLASGASYLRPSELRPTVDEARVRPLLDILVGQAQPLQSVAVLDEAGRPLLGRPPGTSWVAEGYGGDATFLEAVRTHEPTLSFGWGDWSPFWVVPVPSTLEAGDDRYLIGYVSRERLDGVLFSGLSPGTDSFLLDSEGRLVAATDPAYSGDELVLLLAAPPPAEGGVRSFEVEAAPGRGEFIGTVTGLSSYPAQVVLLTTKNHIYRLQEPVIGSALVVSGGLTLVAIGIGVVVSRTVTRPLAEVSRTVHEVAKGDLSARVRPHGAKEIRDLAIDVNHMTESLAGRVQVEQAYWRAVFATRMKSEFIANMSHEFRTPLNAVIGFSELLADGKAGRMTAEQKEYANDIRASGQHLLALINDILDLSRVEAGMMPFRPVPLRAETVADESVASLWPAIREKKLEIRREYDSGIGEVHLDPARLKQVFYNFLSNAIKFSPAESRIDVRVKSEDASFLRVEVQDEGPGISAADLPRLFLPFQQLDAGAAKQHAGTGLGLAVTRRIVEAQGGRVGVTSVPKKGSLFWAVLPRSHDPPGPAPATEKEGESP